MHTHTHAVVTCIHPSTCTHHIRALLCTHPCTHAHTTHTPTPIRYVHTPLHLDMCTYNHTCTKSVYTHLHTSCTHVQTHAHTCGLCTHMQTQTHIHYTHTYSNSHTPCTYAPLPVHVPHTHVHTRALIPEEDPHTCSQAHVPTQCTQSSAHIPMYTWRCPCGTHVHMPTHVCTRAHIPLCTHSPPDVHTRTHTQHARPPILRYSQEYLAGTTPYSRYPSPSLITCPGLCCSLNSSHSLELSQPHVATLRLWTLVTGMISKRKRAGRRGRLRG